MKQDRFLLGILIGIGVIVLLAIVLVAVKNTDLTYLPEDTPEGVVNNYLTAWQAEDYDKVASYLADLENKPQVEDIVRYVYASRTNIENTSMRIESSDVRGDSATVMVTVIQQPYDIFTGTSQNSNVVTLVKQNGKWKITEFPYPYWSWDWYQTPVDYGK